MLAFIPLTWSKKQRNYNLILSIQYVVNKLYINNRDRQIKEMRKKNHKKTERFLDVPELIERINLETPSSGEYFYDYKLEEAKKDENLLNDQQFHQKYKINFADLPISQACIRGLNNRKFNKMTEIQRCVIPHALADRDVIAASRTGSGKTLCYLIPLIEKLYRHKFIPVDGLGGIVIVPVRQLAIQVFEVLNSFTSNIEISVGLVIGGKNVNYQKQKISNMNILICTPGRLLQHLEQTYGFQTTNLQMLILDQADVMMEMGFQSTLKSIVQHLPKCQTMLFSATLTNQIKLLSSMSMNNPQKIFLHSRQHANTGQVQNLYETPAKLMQYYMMVQPQQKINTLYSFLKTHQRQKIIVFVSTCKQVRFIYESFKKFRLGLPMYELQGHQKQKKRMAIYFTFCEKKYGLLICTNIASRGLDFPMIDWVIQFDIPENTETYVHRIGRTARFKYQGKSLTFVSQFEQGFVDQLKNTNIKLHKIKQNPQKFLKIQSSLQSICSEHQDVKYLAQKAVISYLKFVHKASNKAIFNIRNIDTAKLSESFGLINAPVIEIKSKNEQERQDQQEQPSQKYSKIQKLRLKAKLKKSQIKQKKMQKYERQSQQSESQVEQSEEEEQQSIKTQKKVHQIRKQKTFDRTTNKDNEDLLKIKSKHVPNSNEKPLLTVSKNRMKKIRSQGLFDGKNKTHFDEDLNPISDEQFLRRQYQQANAKNIQIERDFTNKIDQNKALDSLIQKQRRKEKRIKFKDQIKEERGEILPERSKSKKSLRQKQDASEGQQSDQN